MSSPLIDSMIAAARQRALIVLIALAALAALALCIAGIITAAEVADKAFDAAIGLALAVRAVKL